VPYVTSLKVGLVGTGTISGIYLKNAAERFAEIDIVAVADLMRDRAEARATEHNIPNVLEVDELIADPSIDIVLNLTIPQAHYEIARKAILAGKSVFSEKPLAVDPADGQQLVDLAREHKVLLGSAPDTFLGTGIQTCRRLLDEGAIGEVVGAAGCFASHGNEHWHPNPAFSYEHGGGPVFNLGPYYLTAMVVLLGPIARITGTSSISFPTRTITSQPLAGQTITVTTPTFVNAAFDFASGAVASFTATYDVWKTERPKIEIYGSEGTLSVPDPNTFGGPVLLYRQFTREWEEIPLDPGFSDNSRGIGLADLAHAKLHGGRHRANDELANHVLEIMHTTQEAGSLGAIQTLKSTCERPDPLDPSEIPVFA
jgi:predicted dehydrogenase